MLLVLPPVLGIALGLLTGGSVVNLERIRVRWIWFFVAAVIVRAAAGFTPLGGADWIRYLYLGFDVAILAWSLMQLRVLPGIWILSLGLALNILVIAANGVHMPVSPESGFRPIHPGGTYVVADASTRLGWLDDWLGIPGWLGGAASPGDLLIAFGIGAVAFMATRFSGSTTKLENPQAGSETGRE